MDAVVVEMGWGHGGGGSLELQYKRDSHNPSGLTQRAVSLVAEQSKVGLPWSESLSRAQNLNPMIAPVLILMDFGGCAFLPFSLGPTGDCSCRH